MIETEYYTRHEEKLARKFEKTLDVIYHPARSES